MESIKESLKRYTDHRIATGGFLQAVLENDLFKAMGKADAYNQGKLKDICVYIYNELPGNCWGSEEIVKQWLNNEK